MIFFTCLSQGFPQGLKCHVPRGKKGIPCESGTILVTVIEKNKSNSH